MGERKVHSQLSEGIRLITTPDFGIKIAVIDSSNEQYYKYKDTMNTIGGVFEVKRIDLPNKKTVLLSVPEGPETFTVEKPYRTGSPSDALYLVKYDSPSNNGSEYHRALLQYLPPYTTSSHHFHPEATETFIPIEGDTYMLRKNQVIKINGETSIGRNEPHMVFSLEFPTLTWISLIGESIDHKQRRKPSITSLQQRLLSLNGDSPH